MIDIGASLAAARRAQGLDVRAAEQLTCMRGKYLTALEENRFDDLPGRTYARAFLRTYAQALDLRADVLVAAFDEVVPEPVDDLPPERPRRARPIPWRFAPLAGAAVLLTLLVWSAWSSYRPSTRIVLPAAQPHAATAAAPPVVAHVRAARKTLQAPAGTVVVRATGGPCWVLARRDGPAGAVLAERTVPAGGQLRLTATRVWLRLGAPWNVTVRRGTHVMPAAGGHAPVNVIV